MVLTRTPTPQPAVSATTTAPSRARSPARVTAAAPGSARVAGTPTVRLSPQVPTPQTLPASVEATMRSAGEGTMIPDTIRRVLERTFDLDLSEVRVHVGGTAAQAADQIGALAFTYGTDIYLGSGANPNDLTLMAHEVAHVVQQQGAPVFQMYSAPGADRFEHEANYAADTAAQGGQVSVRERTGGPRVQKIWLISRVVDWVEDKVWSLLERVAPSLVPILRRGVLEWLKEKLGNAVQSLFDSLTAPIRTVQQIAALVSKHFGNLVAWLREAGAKIVRNDCTPISEAADKIHQVFDGLAAPVVDRVKHYATVVKDFFKGLWDRFGAPIWDLLKRIGGAVWEEIQRIGRWIWEKTQPIRDWLSRAWRWFKNWIGIGEGEEGQNGVLQWFQRKASAAWDWVAARIAPFKRQLLIIVGVLALLSPAGPLIIMVGAVAGVLRGLQWIRQNLRNRQSVVDQRNFLRSTLLPAVLGTINAVSNGIQSVARGITGALTRVVNFINEMANTVSSIPLLGFAGGLIRGIAGIFQGLLNWAIEGVQGVADLIGSGLRRLGSFAQLVVGFLEEVGRVISNIFRITYMLAGRLWNAIPACIRDPFIDFFIPLILRQIPFFRELVATPEAWARTKAEVMRLIQQVFRDFDLMGAIRTAFGLIVRALRIPVELAGQVLSKAAQAWDLVMARPLQFIENALKAGLRGVGLFMRNFLSHLWYGVQGWLLNAVEQSGTGIQPPQSWDLRGLFGFVLSILGISLNHVLDLLATRVGRPMVERIRSAINILTGVWEWVKIAIEEGPQGLWRKVVDSLGNIGTMVLESAVGWVMTRIIAIVSARLTALAASAGLSGVLEAIVAVYQAIQTAIEYATRILQIMLTIFTTIVQIAQGVIDPAAQMLERGLRMAMPVVIGFLANYAGLGGIGGRIREIITDVRARVDAAILGLIDRALAGGRALLERLSNLVAGGASANERLTNGLTAAQAAVNRFAGRRVAGALLRPLLGAIRIRYQLRSLDVVARDGHWFVQGVVNPSGELPTEALADRNEDANVDRPVRMFQQQQTLRGHIENGRMTIMMSGSPFALLREIIDEVHYVNSTDLRSRVDTIRTRAENLRDNLNTVKAATVTAEANWAAAPAANKEGVLTLALNQLVGDLVQIGTQFRVNSLRELIPPTRHRSVSYALTSYSRATGTEGDPISSDSPPFGRSAGSQMVGQTILDGHEVYEKGHLLAESLGGLGSADNLAPMPNLTNRSTNGMQAPEAEGRRAIAIVGTSLRYIARATYEPNGVTNLQTWLENNLPVPGARPVLPNAGGSLFEMARDNNQFTNTAMGLRIFGTTPTTPETGAVSTNHWRIRGELARQFMPKSFTVTIEVTAGTATIASGFNPRTILNHQGVALP